MIFPCVKIDKGSGRKRAKDSEVEQLIASVLFNLMESNDKVLWDALRN